MIRLFFKFSSIVAVALALGAQSQGPLKLNLSDALIKGNENSTGLKEKRQDMNVARAQYSGSRSAFLPTISATFKAGTSKDKDPTTDEPAPEVSREHNTYSGGLTLRQSIFNGMSDYYGAQSAAAALDMSESAVNAERASLRRSIIEDYFAIQLDLAKIKAEEEVQTANRQQLTVVQNRFRAGSVTEVDVLRAKLAEEAQKPTIASMQSELANKQLKFSHKLGIPLDQSFELTVSLEESFRVVSSTILPTLAESFAKVLGSNSRIEALRMEQAKLDADIAKERGAHLPRLDLVATAETRADLRADIGSPDAERLSAYLELNVPIFTGLSSFTQRGTAKARLESLNARFESLKQELLEALSTAYRVLDLSRLRVTSGLINIELAEKTVKQSEAQYRAGRSTLTEVLNSQADLLRARKDYAQALFDGISASAQIQELIGNSSQQEASKGN